MPATALIAALISLVTLGAALMVLGIGAGVAIVGLGALGVMFAGLSTAPTPAPVVLEREAG